MPKDRLDRVLKLWDVLVHDPEEQCSSKILSEKEGSTETQQARREPRATGWLKDYSPAWPRGAIQSLVLRIVAS